METLKLKRAPSNSGWQVLQLWEGGEMIKFTYVKVRWGNEVDVTVFNRSDDKDTRLHALDRLTGGHPEEWASEIWSHTTGTATA